MTEQYFSRCLQQGIEGEKRAISKLDRSELLETSEQYQQTLLIAMGVACGMTMWDTQAKEYLDFVHYLVNVRKYKSHEFFFDAVMSGKLGSALVIAERLSDEELRSSFETFLGWRVEATDDMGEDADVDHKKEEFLVNLLNMRGIVV